MTHEFAKEIDFISIGTNDLIQYIMAVDRGNDQVANLYQAFHPAVLRTISFIINEAAKLGKPVGICGEMAADNQALPLLIGLGLTSLSVTASAILPVKRTIRSLSYEHAKEIAAKCLACAEEDEVFKIMKHFFENEHIPRTRTIL
jgi:phosphotransferase system enzyme I (PtsI)